jgi:hypothetical protein
VEMLRWFAEMFNRLEEEMNYGQDQLRQELSSLTSVGMMNENRFIMWFLNLWKNKILKKKKGGLFLVQGHGGTEKTHTWKTIITKLHSDGKIMHAVTLSCKAQSQNSRVRDR